MSSSETLLTLTSSAVSQTARFGGSFAFGLRREILEPLTNLHLWRNRIAHHDSLLDQDLERRLSEMIEVANAIDPACGGWLGTHTEMASLFEQRPVGD